MSEYACIRSIELPVYRDIEDAKRVTVEIEWESRESDDKFTAKVVLYPTVDPRVQGALANLKAAAIDAIRGVVGSPLPESAAWPPGPGRYMSLKSAWKSVAAERESETKPEHWQDRLATEANHAPGVLLAVSHEVVP